MADSKDKDYLSIINEAENILLQLQNLENEIKDYSIKNTALKKATDQISDLAITLKTLCEQISNTIVAIQKTSSDGINESLNATSRNMKSLNDSINKSLESNSKSIDSLNENVAKSLDTTSQSIKQLSDSFDGLNVNTKNILDTLETLNRNVERNLTRKGIFF